MLSPKKHYLQIALNSTLDQAQKIISQLPLSDRIIIEAGTPLIKRYGEDGIVKLKQWYQQKLWGQTPIKSSASIFPWTGVSLIQHIAASQKASHSGKNQDSFTNQNENNPANNGKNIHPYIVADLKCMDRGLTEVEIAQNAGADAAVALGSAPVETLDIFIEHCQEAGLDAMIDMMNVQFPIQTLAQLKKLPQVVILHRGVDEEEFNKEKPLPVDQIQQIKSTYDIIIAIAGGDTFEEVQRAAFNDADIVVVWKSFYKSSSDTAALAERFLKEVR